MDDQARLLRATDNTSEDLDKITFQTRDLKKIPNELQDLSLSKKIHGLMSCRGFYYKR